SERLVPRHTWFRGRRRPDPNAVRDLRGGVRPYPRCPVHRLSAKHVRGLLAPRGRGESAGGAGWRAAVGARADRSLPAHSWAGSAWRGVDELGDVVRRRRGDAHITRGAGVFPLAAGGSFLG